MTKVWAAFSGCAVRRALIRAAAAYVRDGKCWQAVRAALRGGAAPRNAQQLVVFGYIFVAARSRRRRFKTSIGLSRLTPGAIQQ